MAAFIPQNAPLVFYPITNNDKQKEAQWGREVVAVDEYRFYTSSLDR